MHNAEVSKKQTVFHNKSVRMDHMVIDMDEDIRMTSLDAEQEGVAKRRCNICDRIFKNEQGVRIHQGKSKCKKYLKQRKASKSTQ